MAKALQPTDPRVIELAKHDSIIRFMIERHKPIDRETYKEMMYLFGEPPKFWGPELEDEIPELLRDGSKVPSQKAG
jgi:hypothetical protein